ncbi:MAG: 23S rRNA (guanosine(2251)-2'-O)-methyltransferase RlmB [Bacteroidetes bacterium]|nr:23S rRNA (guanosine(2251)-2'-O)-methyltransferase RlmB [Bacteroidota bacterium]MBX7239813.1 23S rRNA (guanosine(2251)-2'-O)-methyltransferase RlmB [Bacteroidia bacterium]MCC7514003.1 23S rRNA (guanosine(2251)-2'-O)-methyltransferase RlmB [Bacteroidia bacterium]MCW5919324.1 23S rRNA (guanosine(2251)-2'-O)-methyltransferase RlmB [Bacteroidota bacterium]HMU78298.1 23S rRNA (guanosine(2251)-2'-O)-methyltransferase RlmB [Bacteroidia bacterium]
MSNEELIYGTRAVMEAVNAGKDIEKIFIQKGVNNSLVNELRQLLAKNNIPFQVVPDFKLNKLTKGNHQGVVCVLSSITYHKTEDIIPMIFERGEVPLFLMIDRVTDVRNVGAMARTAACAGVHAIIIPDQGSAQLNADAIKTSAGALHNILVCRENNLKLTIEYLKGSGIKIVAATEKASQPYFTSDLKVPCCIIMGSEDSGISPEYLKRADEKVLIPMNNVVQSLNVSVAAGIILFEAYRQRNN